MSKSIGSTFKKLVSCQFSEQINNTNECDIQTHHAVPGHNALSLLQDNSCLSGIVEFDIAESYSS